MKLKTTFLASICLLILNTSYTQCLSFDELTPLFLRNFDGQNQYLTEKGFILNEDSFDPDGFGWDWIQTSTGYYVNIKTKDCNVYTVQYRLLSGEACFK